MNPNTEDTSNANYDENCAVYNPDFSSCVICKYSEGGLLGRQHDNPDKCSSEPDSSMPDGCEWHNVTAVKGKMKCMKCKEEYLEIDGKCARCEDYKPGSRCNKCNFKKVPFTDENGNEQCKPEFQCERCQDGGIQLYNKDGDFEACVYSHECSSNRGAFHTEFNRCECKVEGERFSLLERRCTSRECVDPFVIPKEITSPTLDELIYKEFADLDLSKFGANLDQDQKDEFDRVYYPTGKPATGTTTTEENKWNCQDPNDGTRNHAQVVEVSYGNLKVKQIICKACKEDHIRLYNGACVRKD